MTISKTVRKKSSPVPVKDRAYSLDSTSKLSSTMQIPLVSVVEDLDEKSSSHLEVFQPNRQPQKIELGRKELIIGRVSECGIYLPYSNVSRQHARVFGKGEEFLVEDLDSTNGTFVNGVKISRCILRNNDQIRIGETRIQFVQRKFRV